MKRFCIYWCLWGNAMVLPVTKVWDKSYVFRKHSKKHIERYQWIKYSILVNYPLQTLQHFSSRDCAQKKET